MNIWKRIMKALGFEKHVCDFAIPEWHHNERWYKCNHKGCNTVVSHDYKFKTGMFKPRHVENFEFSNDLTAFGNYEVKLRGGSGEWIMVHDSTAKILNEGGLDEIRKVTKQKP